MQVHAYLFATTSIQSYILDSGKLKDLVGASELVEGICGKLLDDTLAACNLQEARNTWTDWTDDDLARNVVFSRRAGGVFYAFTGNTAGMEQFAVLWPLIVQQYAPGLSFEQGRGSGNNAFEALTAARGGHKHESTEDGNRPITVAQMRSRPLVDLPQAGPMVLRNQRTGRPSTKLVKDPDGEPEPLDRQTDRFRWALKGLPGNLVRKLTPPDSGIEAHHWPKDMEPGGEAAFPFDGDDRYIAVIHADGNGLGRMLRGIESQLSTGSDAEFLRVFRALSNAIATSTREAARHAVGEVLALPRYRGSAGMIAARPIVLGGDDLTFIIRADLALSFTRAFLTAFETATTDALETIPFSGLHIPKRLTACAGIAYIKAGQPFYLGANLANGITEEVKRRAKAVDPRIPPSSLGWHRVTTAMIDDYRDALGRELTVGTQSERFRNTLCSYTIDPTENHALPALGDLIDLQRLMEKPDMARGPARQLLTLIGQSPGQARARYRRWRALMQERDKSGETQRSGEESQLDKFDRLLKSLLQAPAGDLPYRSGQGEPDKVHYVGPLGDLHALLAVKNRTDLDDTDEPTEEDRP